MIPAEAKIVREVMRRFLSGTSAVELCKELNARGVPYTGTRGWFSGTMNGLLRSPRIAGWRQVPIPHAARSVMPEFLVRAQWPAIVSRRQVERAQALLSDDTLRPGSGKRWLLADIAVCGHCGRSLWYSQNHQRRSGRYLCYPDDRSNVPRRGSNLSISAWFLDELVITSLGQAIRDGLIQRVLDFDGDPFAPTAEALQEHQARLAELARDYDSGIISRQEWISRRTWIITRLNRERRATADICDHATLKAIGRAPEKFTTKWNAATLRQQRALIRTLTREIRVSHSAGGFKLLDPDRVRITWRA